MRVWFSKRSNRRLLSGVIRGFLIFLVLIGTAWGMLHLPFISVRSISVSPESDADRALQNEVLAFAEEMLDERVYGVKGKTRFFFKMSTFESMLQDRFLQTDTVRIESGFWNKWRIFVTQRHSFGTSCIDEHCLLVDVNGIAFMNTDMHIGTVLTVSDGLMLGEYVFGAVAGAVADFRKIPEIVLFLENNGLFVEHVSLRKDTRVVHIELENTIGIWLDTSEALYDTTRALHIVFEEVFADPDARKDIVSVDVRNPLSILYERK